jgi:hypothetical protein
VAHNKAFPLKLADPFVLRVGKGPGYADPEIEDRLDGRRAARAAKKALDKVIILIYLEEKEEGWRSFGEGVFSGNKSPSFQPIPGNRTPPDFCSF